MSSPSTKWAWVAASTLPTSSSLKLAVITPIDFDHENFLGHSIEEIAGEKAGIIKSGMRIVSSIDRPEALNVVSTQCDKVRATLFDVDKLWRVDRIESAGDCYRAAISELPQGRSSLSRRLFQAAFRFEMPLLPPQQRSFCRNAA